VPVGKRQGRRVLSGKHGQVLTQLVDCTRELLHVQFFADAQDLIDVVRCQPFARVACGLTSCWSEPKSTSCESLERDPWSADGPWAARAELRETEK
jgi:hypothetical protein